MEDWRWRWRNHLYHWLPVEQIKVKTSVSQAGISPRKISLVQVTIVFVPSLGPSQTRIAPGCWIQITANEGSGGKKTRTPLGSSNVLHQPLFNFTLGRHKHHHHHPTVFFGIYLSCAVTRRWLVKIGLKCDKSYKLVLSLQPSLSVAAPGISSLSLSPTILPAWR